MKKIFLLFALVYFTQATCQTPVLLSSADTICRNQCVWYYDSTITTKPCTYSYAFTGGHAYPCSGCTVNATNDTVTVVLTSSLTPFPPPVKVCYSITSMPFGCFTAQETISSPTGTASTSKCITVMPPPLISFNLQKDTTVASTWNILPSYPASTSTASWNWGDGTSSVGLYPSHTYTTSNWYNVCVTATITNSPCTPAACHYDTLYRMSASTASSMVHVNVVNNSVGINQIVNSYNQLAIYPYPANDQFYINANTNEQLIVDLYSLNGQHIFSTRIMDNSKINVANLDEGIYTLTIKTGNRILNKKLAIIR